MSLEDFTRELNGKPPLNRNPFDRMTVSDESGCSYDREAFVTPLHFGVGLAFAGGLLLVAWASGGDEWTAITDKVEQLWDFAVWLFGG